MIYKHASIILTKGPVYFRIHIRIRKGVPCIKMFSKISELLKYKTDVLNVAEYNIFAFTRKCIQFYKHFKMFRFLGP